jgi:hypothetical protein
MAYDTNVFDKQITLLDRARLQQEFEMKKQQAAAQVANALKPELGLKDILMLQMQQQNKDQDFDIRREALAQQAEIARQNNEARSDLAKEKRDEKKNTKMLNDQNALGGYSSEIDNQMALIDEVLGAGSGLDENGNPINVKYMPGLEGNLGARGQYIPNIAGTDAANAEAKLNQIDAKTFLKTLGDLKNQSATGASGLGSLTESEGKKIQAAAAALSRSQDAASYARNLLKYKSELAASKQRMISGYQNLYGEGNSQSPAITITPEAARAELARRAAAKAGQ